MLEQLILSILLVGVARVHGVEYLLDTEADITQDWVIACTPGYHENADFDCGLGEGPLIPTIDQTGNRGYWTRCGDGNGGISCDIHFRPRSGSNTLTKLGVRAYIQGGSKIEVGIDGDNPGTIIIEGDRWTNIDNLIDISPYVPFRDIRLTMEFGSHFYFSMIDQINITDGVGGEPTTVATTTTLQPSTETPTVAPTTTSTPETTATEPTITDPATTTTTTPPPTTTTSTAPPPTTTNAPPPSSTARLCPHVTCPPFIDGNYADPQDCTGFVQCVSGIPYCQKCPENLRYHISEDKCLLPNQVDCGTRPIP